jgi:S-adenosyl methyltransferase
MGTRRGGELAGGGFDPAVASFARIYDYWLGGKDNFAVDREAAEEAIAANPGIVSDVREQGVLVAGGAVPGRGGRHHAVPRYRHRPADGQQHPPGGAGLRAVESDRLCRQRPRGPGACLGPADQHPEGATAYLDNDLRDVSQILEGASATLDLRQPVALMLLIVLHLIPDADDPHGIVTRLMDRLARGSYLVISHPASGIGPAAMVEMARRVNARLGSAKGTMRDRADVARFFDGLTLLEPGVVQPQQWQPEGGLGPAVVTAWRGVARSTWPLPAL